MKKLAVLIIAISSLLGVKKVDAQVGVGVSIAVAPPELPVYDQPACPTDGYLWSPGYWAYGPGGYYWVPGVWVAPPQMGFLWTPGYWGYTNGSYFWNGGYWGENVGFYGGVCYGYGYGGSGFYGGRWQGGHFQYNTAAWRVNNTVIHNTYVDRTVIHNTSSRSSYNGPGGVTRQPNASEQSAARENHLRPTAVQQSHEQKASANRNQASHPSGPAKSGTTGGNHNPVAHPASSVHTVNHSVNNNRPAAAANHTVNNSRPAGTHPANNAVHSSQRQQPQQHSAVHNRPAAQPQHQSRPAQRPTQPGRATQGGGGHEGGGEGKR